MRLPHHLLRHASGVYHFRLVVPRDLHAAVGLRIIKRSLRTRDPRAAKIGAWALSASYARAFAMLRTRDAMTKPPPIDEILAGFADGTTRPYVIDRKQGIFQSDGAEDHERAMAMMAAAERLVRAEAETHQQARAAEEARAQADAVEGSVLARVKAQLDAKAAGELQILDAAIAHPRTTGARGFSVREMITHWEAVEAGDMLAATADTRRKAVEDFATHFGEKRPIADVRRMDVASWVAGHAQRGNSRGTRKGKASHLKMFFECAITSGHYPVGVHGNPADKAVPTPKGEKKARARSHGWVAFTLSQLQVLFAPANLKRTWEPHTRRGLLIGLYTGARVGEVAQLEVGDFTVESGVKCVRFQGEMKTEVSRRLIPLHPDLLRMGLWDWKDEQKKRGETRLFPTVSLLGKSGKGSAISKGASNLLSVLKIAAPEGKTTRVGFHSFRDTVIQELQGAAVELPEERRRAYVGHAQYERQDNSSHALHYMRKWTPKEIEGLHVGITWGQWLDIDALKTLLAQTDSDAVLKKAKRVAKRTPALG